MESVFGLYCFSPKFRFDEMMKLPSWLLEVSILSLFTYKSLDITCRAIGDEILLVMNEKIENMVHFNEFTTFEHRVLYGCKF